MAHRGRLNVLANIVGKPLGQIFSEFEGNIDPLQHAGFGRREVPPRRQRRPPHRIRAERSPFRSPPIPAISKPSIRWSKAWCGPSRNAWAIPQRERVIPLLVHGDAAFAGQGVVAETLNLSQLDGYCTGGTIHLVINNQIGFTTLPDDSRSTHVFDRYRPHGAGAHLPRQWRRSRKPPCAWSQTGLRLPPGSSRRDVVIDMICYRRHGHNEGDDPGYTQPIMYRKIKEQPSVAVQYGERLVARGRHHAAPSSQAMRRKPPSTATLRRSIRPSNGSDKFHGLRSGAAIAHAAPAVRRPWWIARRSTAWSTASPISRRLSTCIPSCKGFVEKRRETFAKNGPIDWAFAEAMAFGSLVLEGTPVRLSGQDSGRGTFSQRHLAFYDFENGERYIPLQHMRSPDQARFRRGRQLAQRVRACSVSSTATASPIR